MACGIFSSLSNPPAGSKGIKKRSLLTCWKQHALSVLNKILCVYLYLLVRAVDHGNEHVEKDDHHCDVIDAIQHVANVLYELMVVL